MSKNKLEIKLNRSNDAHERLEGYYNDKKVQLIIKSRSGWLSEKELKNKNVYEIKERYHKMVRSQQIQHNAIAPKDRRKRLYRALYKEYF